MEVRFMLKTLAFVALALLASSVGSAEPGTHRHTEQEAIFDKIGYGISLGAVQIPNVMIIAEARVERVDDTTLRLVPADENGSVVFLTPDTDGEAIASVMLVREAFVRLIEGHPLEFEFHGGVLLKTHGGRLGQRLTFDSLIRHLQDGRLVTPKSDSHAS